MDEEKKFCRKSTGALKNLDLNSAKKVAKLAKTSCNPKTLKTLISGKTPIFRLLF
jgi:hypothetical protein